MTSASASASSPLLISLRIKYLRTVNPTATASSSAQADAESNHTVTLPHSSTVLQLKERIESIVEVPKHLQRLIFRGRVLKDDHTLQSYNILDNDVLHLVSRPFHTETSSRNDQPNQIPSQHRSAGRHGPGVIYSNVVIDIPIGSAPPNLNQIFSEAFGGSLPMSGATSGIVQVVGPNGVQSFDLSGNPLTGNPTERDMRSSNYYETDFHRSQSDQPVPTSTESGQTPANRPRQNSSSGHLPLPASTPFLFPQFRRSLSQTNLGSSFNPSLFNSSSPPVTSQRSSSTSGSQSAVDVRLARAAIQIENLERALQLGHDFVASSSSVAHSSPEHLHHDFSALLTADSAIVSEASQAASSSRTPSERLGSVLQAMIETQESLSPFLSTVAENLQQQNQLNFEERNRLQRTTVVASQLMRRLAHLYSVVYPLVGGVQGESVNPYAYVPGQSSSRNISESLGNRSFETDPWQPSSTISRPQNTSSTVFVPMPTSQPSINNPYAEAPGQDGPNRAHDRLDNNQRTIPLRRSSLTGLEGRVRGGLASDRSNRSSNPTENSNDSSRRTGQTITEGNDSYRETMSSGTTAQPNSDTVSQNVQGDPLAFVYDLLSGAMFSADNGNQRSTWTQASNPQQNSSATQTLVNQTSQSSTQTGSSGGFFDLLRNVMANGNGVVMFGDSGGAGIAGSRSNRVTAQARRTNGTVGTPASSSRPSTSTTEPQSNRRPENASASRSARRTTPTNGNNTSSSRKSTDASRVTYNLGRLGSLVSSILRIHDSRRSENPPRMLAEVLFPYSPSSSCDSTSMGYLYRRMAEVLTVREARQIMDGNPHALRNIHPVLNEYIRNTILNGSSITEDSIDRATSFFVERLLLSMDLDRYLESIAQGASAAISAQTIQATSREVLTNAIRRLIHLIVSVRPGRESTYTYWSRDVIFWIRDFFCSWREALYSLFGDDMDGGHQVLHHIATEFLRDHSTLWLSLVSGGGNVTIGVLADNIIPRVCNITSNSSTSSQPPSSTPAVASALPANDAADQSSPSDTEARPNKRRKVGSENGEGESSRILHQLLETSLSRANVDSSICEGILSDASALSSDFQRTMRNDVAYHRSVRETLADLEVGFEQPTVSSQDDVKCDEIDEDVSCNNIDDILEDSKSLTDVSTKYESPERLGLEDSDKSAEVDIAKMDLDVAKTVSANGKECSDDK